MLAVQFALRLVFWVYNHGSADSYTWSQALWALGVGMRFDLATTCMVAGIPLMLLGLPIPLFRRPRAQKVFTGLLMGMILLVGLANCIDVVYYGFAAKRLTHELFTTGSDLSNFGLSEILPYVWLLALWAALGWLFFRVCRRAFSSAEQQVLQTEIKPFKQWPGALLFTGLLFLGMRGGWQLRPLRPADAFVTPSFFLGNVALNSGYTILSSIDIGQEIPVEFMPAPLAHAKARTWYRNDFDSEFVSDEFPLVRKANFPGPERKLNVVLLIMESLNASKVGAIQKLPLSRSLTPNLDTLANHGRLYTYFYSNGSRSVESLPALFNSIPELFDRPTIGSSYETNRNWGIGNILSARGYHNSFFCGGENGTMGFDSYSRVSGIPHYFGKDEFPNPGTSNTGNWGVHDGPFSAWMAQMQSDFPQPFLSVWFSISNHFPFAQPADCPPHFSNRGLSPNDLTLMYADHALGQYFQAVSKQAWADSTLFIITGDHCFYGQNDAPRPFMDNFHVPLLMIGPGVKPGLDSTLGSHLNLLPTLIELLRLDTYHASAGVSLLSKQQPTSVLNHLMGVLSFTTGDESYATNFESPQPCLKLKNGKWESNPDLAKQKGTAYDSVLKAIFQVCQYNRIHNKVMSAEWMK
jgi:uncharacterized sulfatase